MKMIKMAKKYLIILGTFLTIGIMGGCGKVDTDVLAGGRMKTVGSAAKLQSIIAKSMKDKSAYAHGFFTDVAVAPGSANNSATESAGTEEREFTKTNTQVEGVDEADIIKTDGNTIYYSSPYTNKIHAIDVDNEYLLKKRQTIDLKDLFVTNFYMTAKYLAVFGFTYEIVQYGETMIGMAESAMSYYSYRTMSQIVLIDRATLTIAYNLKLDFFISDHRLIDDTLFVVGFKTIYSPDVDLQPTFNESRTNEEPTEWSLGYQDIHYFEDENVRSINILFGLKLTDDISDIKINSEGYLGNDYGYQSIYASKDRLYVVNNLYKYEMTAISYKSWNLAQIASYKIDVEHATLTFEAAGVVEGSIKDSYSLDEYDNHLRIVTTDIKQNYNQLTSSFANGVKNQLFIIKATAEGEFVIIGQINEGIGKPGEMIKSVRFNEGVLFIVTFLQIDPLYQIDVSNPASPRIVGALEQPGYDGYQHVWGENRLIGIGYEASENGWINGIKISAYSTVAGEEKLLDKVVLAKNETTDGVRFISEYTSVLNNPRALLVDVERGYLGFAVSGSAYYIDNAEGGSGTAAYRFDYYSSFKLFKIDFDNETEIIKQVAEISHLRNEEMPYLVDRGIIIDDYLYIFSMVMATSYKLSEQKEQAPIYF